jgi:hypothetical protein
MKENNNFLNNLNNISKGIITGIFAAYIIIYSLRPSVKNPKIVLEIIENKIIFIPLIIINYYLFIWDKTIAVFFLIFIISLIFDYFIFINKKDKLFSFNQFF